MKPYDRDAACQKCGSADVQSFFHASEGYPNRCHRLRVEHIDRHYKNCHFQWEEAPLDATQPEVKP